MERRREIEDNQQGRGECIVVAGFGGQGIMLCGKIIAQAAVLENKNVTYMRSYGAEMRGGTAHCSIRISDGEIASPVFDEASIVFAMNQQSLDKFVHKLCTGGLLIVNNSAIQKIPRLKGMVVAGLGLNQLALDLGSLKVANVIGLGLLLRKKPIVEISSIERILEDIFKTKKELLRINREALKAGYGHG